MAKSIVSGCVQVEEVNELWTGSKRRGMLEFADGRGLLQEKGERKKQLDKLTGHRGAWRWSSKLTWFFVDIAAEMAFSHVTDFHLQRTFFF